MAATKPRIRYTAREFATILSALEEYVRAARPELWTDFFESSLGQVLIEIVAYVGDVLSFSIDRVGQEVNISTAKRYASALRFAESVGYRPAGPTPATVDIKVQNYDTANPTPDQLTIVKGTRVCVPVAPSAVKARRSCCTTIRSPGLSAMSAFGLS